MRSAIVPLCLALVVGLLAGCSDDGIDYPVGDGSWQLALSVADTPDVIDEFPVFVSVLVQAVDLSSGARPQDGSVFELTASNGWFPNGLRQIDLGATGGVVETELRVDYPGWFEITAVMVEECASTTVRFSVGL